MKITRYIVDDQGREDFSDIRNDRFHDTYEGAKETMEMVNRCYKGIEPDSVIYKAEIYFEPID